MAYTKYSLTPADNNAAPPNGAPEGMLPSAVNDTMRDMMSQIRDVGDGIRGGTYTMTAPVITGGSITGVALSGNTLTNPVITGGSVSGTTMTSVVITSGSISGITDLAVTDGGTGASTAANARTNLSAAASGANSDITSLTGLTTPLSQAQGGTGTTTGYYGFKNRIINGQMTIDQRNAGASVTPAAGNYTLDRWNNSLTQSSKYSVQQNAGSVTPPAGFRNYLGVTSLSAYSVLSGDFFLQSQWIEGFNTADLNWGSANAKTVTLSFWVRSSLTGTFGGSITNSAQDRSYPFTYTISSANTWEYKNVTIPGDTTGTWIGATNGRGLGVWFGLGAGADNSGTAGAWTGSAKYTATGAVSVVGTNGATFYLTGVQLEVGSNATSFDYRPFGTELALCQRYFQKSFAYGTAPANGLSEYGNAANTTSYATAVPFIHVKYSVQLRATPATVNLYNPRSGGTAGQVTNSASDSSGTSVVNNGEKGFMVQTASQDANNWYVHWDSSAEL